MRGKLKIIAPLVLLLAAASAAQDISLPKNSDANVTRHTLPNGLQVVIVPNNLAPVVTVEEIGNALMGRYVLPLEIVALLLTAALIGAVIVAMHEKEGAK